MLTSHDTEQSIMGLCVALEEETYNFATLSRDEAEAEADYKQAFATTMLELASNTELKMTAQTREAFVDDKCSGAFRTLKIAQARKGAGREMLLSLRSRLDAMRTLSATLRSQT